MTTEMLDTLLLDRALDELSPEVAALLDTYLATNPDAVKRHSILSETLRDARAATHLPSEAPNRPLDIGRLRRTYRVERSARHCSEGLRLAACLALGLGLGLFAHAPQREHSVAAAVLQPSRVGESVAGTSSTVRFWSKTRVLAADHVAPKANHRQSQYELRWESLTKMPRLEEKL